jgi:hypothetical protein
VAGVNVPVELEVKPTLPVGEVVVLTSVSVTVAVQSVEPLLATWLGLQLTDMEVVRLFTVTEVLPELVLCVASPA